MHRPWTAAVIVHLRLAHKLFLLLALIVALALGTLGALSAINLHQGFVGYLNQQDLQRLEPLARALHSELRQGRSLSRFRTPERWQALLRANLPTRPAPSAPDMKPEAPPAAPRPPARPEPPAPPPPPAATLAPRITLQDASHHTLAGPPAPPDALLRPLQSDGTTRGWLALAPLHAVTRHRDTTFLHHQLSVMAWTGAALLTLALGVAFAFARYMLAPLHRVTDATARLAAGDFSVRLTSRRRDELGDLERHVNGMASALSRHEHARRHWMADMSHELRTPLSILRGELESMLDGVTRADTASVRSLHEEIMRMQRLVDDLHQVAMTDLHVLGEHRRATNLAQVTHAVAKRMRPRIEAKRLTLTTELAATSREAMLDPDHIRQLLYNLLENSLRYTDAGGTVHLTVREDARTLHLRIEDSAPGIPDDACTRIFEPLYRVETSRNRELGGSGLGLTICRSIVSAHGGEIRARPSPLGGLCIDIHLPLRSA